MPTRLSKRARDHFCTLAELMLYGLVEAHKLPTAHAKIIREMQRLQRQQKARHASKTK